MPPSASGPFGPPFVLEPLPAPFFSMNFRSAFDGYYFGTLSSSLATTHVQASSICASTSSWAGTSREKRARALRAGANPRAGHNLRWPAAFDDPYNCLRLSRASAHGVEPHRPGLTETRHRRAKNHCTFCVSRDLAAAHRAVPQHGAARELEPIHPLREYPRKVHPPTRLWPLLLDLFPSTALHVD